MAYHFYRLIGRARNVVLLYNNDTEGMKSGEMSRYIYQLKYLYRYPFMLDTKLKYPAWAPQLPQIQVEKSEEIQKRLQRYMAGYEGDDKKFLSASAIKQFLNCELKFLLGTLTNFSDPDDDYSHIDDSVYGLIVHYMMEQIYSRHLDRKENLSITAADLQAMLDDPKLITGLAIEAVNKKYKLADTDAPLKGEMKIFCEMAIKCVRALLEAEKAYLEKNNLERFEILGTEWDNCIEFEVAPGLKLNFRYIIDRVDRIYGKDGSSSLRIIDYKTGSDSLKFESVESLVDYSSEKENYYPPEAITQLMLYSILYANDPSSNVKPGEPIQNLIYKFRDIMKGEDIGPLEIKKIKEGKKKPKYDPVPSYNTDKMDMEFMELLRERIVRLFDPSQPFVQTASPHACKYCDFKDICQRAKKKW